MNELIIKFLFVCLDFGQSQNMIFVLSKPLGDIWVLAHTQYVFKSFVFKVFKAFNSLIILLQFTPSCVAALLGSGGLSEQGMWGNNVYVCVSQRFHLSHY